MQDRREGARRKWGSRSERNVAPSQSKHRLGVHVLIGSRLNNQGEYKGLPQGVIEEVSSCPESRVDHSDSPVGSIIEDNFECFRSR